MQIHLTTQSKLSEDQRAAVDMALHYMRKADWPDHPRSSMLACPCQNCVGRVIVATLESVIAADDEPAQEYVAENNGNRIWEHPDDVILAEKLGRITSEQATFAEMGAGQDKKSDERTMKRVRSALRG